MKNTIAILALLAALPAGVVLADDEPVDCFYESNAGNSLCQKNNAPDRLSEQGAGAVDPAKPAGNDGRRPHPHGVAAVSRVIAGPRTAGHDAR